MKKIKTDDLYQNLSSFLAARGIELKEGAYAGRLRQGCGLLTDCINFAQGGVAKAKHKMDAAKGKMDAKLQRMRQIIHERTAPKPSADAPPPSEAQPPSDSEPVSAPRKAKKKAPAPKPGSAAAPKQPKTRKTGKTGPRPAIPDSG